MIKRNQLMPILNFFFWECDESDSSGPQHVLNRSSRHVAVQFLVSRERCRVSRFRCRRSVKVMSTSSEGEQRAAGEAWDVLFSMKQHVDLELTYTQQHRKFTSSNT